MITNTVKFIGMAALVIFPLNCLAQTNQTTPNAPTITMTPKEDLKPVTAPQTTSNTNSAVPTAPSMPAMPKDAAIPSEPTTITPSTTTSTTTSDSTVAAPLVTNTNAAPITADSNAIQNQSPITVIPAPTIPSADNTLLDKAVKAMESNDVDSFVTIFDSSNFVFFTPKGDKVSNMPELKVQWGTLFGANGALKGVKATFTPARMVELNSGATSYDGSIVFITPENKNIRAIISGSMKYDDSSWKIATMNFSSPDLIKIQTEQELMAKKSSTSPLFVILFGFILGAVVMYYITKNKLARETHQ